MVVASISAVLTFVIGIKLSVFVAINFLDPLSSCFMHESNIMMDAFCQIADELLLIAYFGGHLVLFFVVYTLLRKLLELKS